MSFEPATLDFHRSDNDKVLKFITAANAPTPWNVQSATINGSPVDRTKWTFVPTPVKEGSKMKGTLHLDPTAFSEAALNTAWPLAGQGSVPLVLVITFHGIPQPAFTVNLMA